jgi:hypothetical protein
VRIYSETAPFALLETNNPSGSGFPLNSVAATAGKSGTYAVTYWQGEMAFDPINNHYLDSELNAGDSGQVFNKSTNASVLTFGTAFDPGVTAVFNRTTGAQIGSIPNPTTMSGEASQVAIYTNGAIIALMTPGPDGSGVSLYDAKTLELLSVIDEPYADSVTTVNNGATLAIGTEAGTVALWNIANCRGPVRGASINLWSVFGNINIEIRSLFSVGDMVYAGSSGGTTPTDPNTPEYFAFKVGK